MQAWLGVLQTQLAASATRTDAGSVITTLHQGWLEKRGEGKSMLGGDGWKRRFFVLSARQEQVGDDLQLHFTPSTKLYSKRDHHA